MANLLMVCSMPTSEANNSTGGSAHLRGQSQIALPTATLYFEFAHWLQLGPNVYTERKHMVAVGQQWGSAAFGPTDYSTGLSPFTVIAGMVPSSEIASKGFTGPGGIPFSGFNIYQTLGYAGDNYPNMLEFVTYGTLLFRPTYGQEQFAYGIDMAVGKLGDRWWLASLDCEGTSLDPPSGFICGNKNWVQLGFFQTSNPSVLRVELLNIPSTSTSSTVSPGTTTSVTTTTTTSTTSTTTITSTTRKDPCAAACKAVNDGWSCRPSSAPCPTPAKCLGSSQFGYYCTVQGTSCQGKCR
eukprot:TRINITY_DN8167_c0_g2_i1.p1 TRINITY_DN8167_c0_g2~~TRINITY_DN8167_c0_g2_i1.p1  ORF type:complete len:325 (-),score=28.01 TRINITY_DN8167_c0_g2_i1:232-1122(-)